MDPSLIRSRAVRDRGVRIEMRESEVIPHVSSAVQCIFMGSGPYLPLHFPQVQWVTSFQQRVVDIVERFLRL